VGLLFAMIFGHIRSKKGGSMMRRSKMSKLGSDMDNTYYERDMNSISLLNSSFFDPPVYNYMMANMRMDHLDKQNEQERRLQEKNARFELDKSDISFVDGDKSYEQRKSSKK